MATVSTAELTNILEKVIDPMLRSLHVEANKCPLVRMWMEGRNGGEGTSTMDGITYYISVQHSKHSNMQTQAEGATLLRGRSRDNQASFVTKDLNGSFSVTYKAKKASENRAGALIDTLMNESESMLKRAQIMQAFYANNDGTGVVAAVNDGSPNSKSTVTINSVRGTALTILLNVGDTLGAGTSGARTGGTGFNMTVNSVDSETQITIAETTAGMANANLIYFSESYDSNGAVNTSKTGVDALLATSGTVQGIALANAAYYQTNLDATSEAIGESRVLQYLQLASVRMVDPSAFIITMGDVWYKMVIALRGTAYSHAEQANRLFNGGAKGLKMEWFDGSTPIVFDPFCQPGYVLGMDLHQFGYKQLYPLHLVEDGQQLAHRITQKLEYEVAATESGNYYVIDPKACFKLTGKT